MTNTHSTAATAYSPDPVARPTASDTRRTPASFGSSICARYRTRPAAPAMANARARLSATMIITTAPTTASSTWAWMTCDDLDTRDRRIGRMKPSAPARIAASGSVTSACLNDASWPGMAFIIGGLPATDGADHWSSLYPMLLHSRRADIPRQSSDADDR